MTSTSDHERRIRLLIAALALGCVLQSFVLASAAWFDRVLAILGDISIAGENEQIYVSLVATWADGTYDTTLGYHRFGPQVFLFAFLFALAGFGTWKRRIWGYSLLMLLAWIGLLEPVSRLAAIRYFVPDGDTLGYVLDVRQSQVAIIVASLPSAAAIATLLLPNTRRAFGKLPSDWRQFTLSSIATATAVFAILLTRLLSLSQVYGPFIKRTF